MLYKAKIAVFSEIHSLQINPMWAQCKTAEY